MKTYIAKEGEVGGAWLLFDAADKPLGRLAVRVANDLRGRTRPQYTPHVDTGDFVVVVNAGKVKLTGRKEEQKEYQRFTGYRDGLKRFSAAEVRAKHPERMIELAVSRMLPKNRLNRKVLRRLKVYAGDEHPHAAQKPLKVE